MESAGQTLRWCKRQCDLHSPMSNGWPERLGRAFTAACPSENQHVKTVEVAQSEGWQQDLASGGPER